MLACPAGLPSGAAVAEGRRGGSTTGGRAARRRFPADPWAHAQAIHGSQGQRQGPRHGNNHRERSSPGPGCSLMVGLAPREPAGVDLADLGPAPSRSRESASPGPAGGGGAGCGGQDGSSGAWLGLTRAAVARAEPLRRIAWASAARRWPPASFPNLVRMQCQPCSSQQPARPDSCTVAPSHGYLGSQLESREECHGDLAPLLLTRSLHAVQPVLHLPPLCKHQRPGCSLCPGVEIVEHCRYARGGHRRIK